jgi:hypothetical protein
VIAEVVDPVEVDEAAFPPMTAHIAGTHDRHVALCGVYIAGINPEVVRIPWVPCPVCDRLDDERGEQA